MTQFNAEFKIVSEIVLLSTHCVACWGHAENRVKQGKDRAGNVAKSEKVC